MALSKGIGVRFSELKDNHEPAPYWVWNRRDVRTCTRFGVLPNGGSFGVAHTPTQKYSYARELRLRMLQQADDLIIEGALPRCKLV